MSATTERQLTESTAKESFRPRLLVPTWQWAEQFVRLSVRTTASPGKYDSSWMPYVRGWQQAFSDPRIREIVICASVQCGKTESLLNCIRHAVATDPGPMLWVMPAENLARSFSETRLQPSFRDCKPCADQIPSDSDHFKLLEMHFKNCTLNLCGANSPGQLSSRPIRYLFLDEVDKYPAAGDREASAVDLARARVGSFWNRKVIMCSTPTTEAGAIWEAWLTGDQQKFHLPCPLCGHKQELVFSQLKWDDNDLTHPGGKWNMQEVERSTRYQCAQCKGLIHPSHKATMLRAGEWKPTNPQAPTDRVSFHLCALYSPWRAWGVIAREFLEAKASIGGLQAFRNSVEAKPWKLEMGEKIDEVRLMDLRQDYKLGECPIKPHRLTLAADVQRDSVYFTVRAWGEDSESWLIDNGQIPALDDLTEVLSREYKVRGTDDVARISRGMIDSGFNTQHVYDYCLRSRGRCFPCKGWTTGQRKPLKRVAINFLPTGSSREYVMDLYHFDDHVFKSELLITRIQDRDGAGWHLPHNVGTAYIKQLCAERLVEKKNSRGKMEQVWVLSHRDNHYLDCEKIQLIEALLLGGKLKGPVGPKPVPLPAAAPPQQQRPVRRRRMPGMWSPVMR